MNYINNYVEAETTAENYFFYDDATSLDEVNLSFWFDTADYKINVKKTAKSFISRHMMTIAAVVAILVPAIIKLIVRYC